MIVSVHWLRQFVDIPESTNDLADLLTLLGFEADIPTNHWDNENIVAAHVHDCVPHPNADKLKLCQIDDGNSIKQVVCGAPNIDKNQMVAFARLGTLFSDGFKIKKAKIRGEESFGMVCSERELGISDDHVGIMILDNSVEKGIKLSQCLSPFLDTIELDITPNRPDAMSHVGIAREIASKLDRELQWIQPNPSKYQNKYALDITLDNAFGCPRYIGGIMENITMNKSPQWMIDSLISTGMRPVNCLVDISNYVLLEMGHPTHIFDLKHFPDRQLCVRNAKRNEALKCLDGQLRKCNPDHLLITNGNEPVALAGIMGGEKSAVSDQTNSVLLESAYFDPLCIRKGSKNFGISTEASKRFERGADPNGCEPAFWRIVELVKELCGGELVSNMTDSYPQKISSPKITLRTSEIKRVSGIDISHETVDTILKKLGVSIQSIGDGEWQCEPPSYRPDLYREIDLIEDIIRVNGYDKIPSKGSYAGVSQPMVRDPHNGLHFLRNLLVGMGFRQCYSNSLQTESISKINGNSIKLMNPHSDTMTHLRTSLIPGLIDSLNMNVNNHVQDIQLFECGSVHHQVKNERKETIKLSGIVFGNFMSNSIHKESQSQAHSLFTIKGHLESILKKLCMNNYKIEKEVNPLFSPGFKLMYKKSTVGYFGKISNKLITEMVTKDIYDVLGFELCTKPFMDCLDKINQYKPISKFPKMEREINFVTKNSLDSGKISTLIKNSGKGLIKSIIPVNLYRHDSLGNDKKSIVFKLIFQSETKTLIDQDVNSIIDQIIKKVSSSFDVELRA